MSLVTPPRRLVVQVFGLVVVACSSSLVTPLAYAAGAACGTGWPPATPAPAGRFPGLGSNRGFPVARASVAGSQPCSHGDTPAPRNGAGVCAGAHQPRRTVCNANTCAALRGSCPHRSPPPPRRQSFVRYSSTRFTGGEKSTGLKKSFFMGRLKKTHRRSGEFQTARRR